MDLLQAIGTLMSFTAFALIAAGVMKAFQISTDLVEIKDLLRDIRRNGEDHSPTAAREAVRKNQDLLLREMDENAYAAALVSRAGASSSAEALARVVNEEAPRPVTPSAVMPPPPPMHPQVPQPPPYGMPLPGLQASPPQAPVLPALQQEILQPEVVNPPVGSIQP